MYIDYWGSTSMKCLCEEEFENVDWIFFIKKEKRKRKMKKQWLKIAMLM